MMYSVNINPNLLNISGNEKITFPNNTSDFSEFFKELLNLIIENKDFINGSSILFIPFQGLPIQGINNLNDFLQAFDIKEGKSAIYELFVTGKMDLKVLLESLKSRDEINQNIPLLEEFVEINSASLKLNQIKDIFKKLISQQEKSDTEFPIFKINGQNNELKENVSNLIEIVNESSQNENLTELKVNNSFSSINEEFLKFSEFSENKINEISISKEQKIKNNSLSSQITINSGTSSQDNNTVNSFHQKMEIPFTRLNEVSEVIFKALSASQKSLVVQLEPPELGRILIKLSMDNSGLRADMKVDYPNVKEALTALIPEIKSNLQSSGIKVSDFLLDLMRDQRGYSDSYYGQGQKRYKDNQKFFEYFV